MAVLRPLSTDPLSQLAGRVLADLDTLVGRMGRAYRDEIPEYAAVPEEDFGHVLATSRRLTELFLASVVEQRPYGDIDLAFLATVGERRLDMGVPLDSALHAFRIAGRVVWDATVDSAGPDEVHALARLAGHWIDYVDRASSAFAGGYLAASAEHLRRLDTRRRAIVDAILEVGDAGDVAAVAARYSLTIPRAYAPVLLYGDCRVDRMLDAAPRDALIGERGDRILALLPDTATDVERLAAAAGAGLVAWGDPAAPGAALLDEVQRVETVIEAARNAGHTVGAFGPDDLLVERLLATDGRVAAALRRRVLVPLAERDPDGVFAATLRTYLATGSVPATAGREHVHPNTVAYRLRRIRELTGLDPKIPTEAALLVLALASEGGPS